MPDAVEIDSTSVSLTRRGLAERCSAVAFFSAVTAAPALTLFSLNEWPMALAWAWVAAGPLAWAAGLALYGARGRSGRVAVDGERVRVEAGARAATFSCADVVEARVEPSVHGCAVELWRRGGVVLRFEAGSIERAHAWLDGAGFALHRRVSRVVLGAAWHRWAYAVGYAFVGMVVAPIVTIPALWALPRSVLLARATLVAVWAAFTVAATARSAPARVEVGTDGVLVRKGFSKRFIPYPALHAATAPDGDTLDLHLVAEPIMRLKTTSPGDRAAVKVAAAITYAIDRWRKARSVDDLGLLDRKGRAVEAWREAVGATLAPQGAFRGVALDREAVLRVLEDPSAPHERRVGAALALAGTDGAAATRVRVVIDGCANEALRDALEAAVEGRLDDATLARTTA